MAMLVEVLVVLPRARGDECCGDVRAVVDDGARVVCALQQMERCDAVNAVQMAARHLALSGLSRSQSPGRFSLNKLVTETNQPWWF